MKKTASILIILCLGAAATAKDFRNTEEIINSILSEEQAKAEGAQKKEDPAAEQPGAVKQPKKPAAVKEAPVNAGQDGVILKTGIQFYQSSLYNNALANFQKLVANYPQSPFIDTARVWTGRTLIKLYRYQDAARELAAVPEDSGEFPASLFHTAECYQAMGNNLTAIEYFQRIATQFTDHELADNALYQGARLYLKEKKGRQAMESTIQLIKYYGDRETIDDAYYFLARIFQEDQMLKDLESARKVYKIFIRKSRDGAPYFANSPLLHRVQRELDALERKYFKMEQ